jgi:hypothetical protein
VNQQLPFQRSLASIAPLGKNHPMAEFSYEQRYGKARSQWKRAAIGLSLIFLAWLVWAGVHHANPAIRYTLISFAPQSSTSIEIRYEVVRSNPAKSVTCTLVARDIDKNIVGEINQVFSGMAKRRRAEHAHTYSCAAS